MELYDVTIIGAGVSGLTCARQLLERGYKVCLLEARPRIGGRILSHRYTKSSKVAAHAHPPELGAEFIHGAAPVLLDLLSSAGMTFIDAADEHLFLKNGKLQKKEHFWEQMEMLTKKLNPQLKADRTVADFLKHTGNSISGETRKLFQAYVEGFQAADLNIIGERALAEAEQAEEKNLGGIELFRPTGGYTKLIENSFNKASGLKRSLRLNCIAKTIHWDQKHVTVTTQMNKKNRQFHAKTAVLTLPVGVLRSSGLKASLTIEPPIADLNQGLNSLVMGHVQRITFEFKTRFWEELSEDPVSFLHAGPENYFPTWWTQLPARTPYLVAWQGGPKAIELGNLSDQQRVQKALLTLSKLSGKTLHFLRQNLVAHFTHDWSHDPFSLGAYAYTGVKFNESTERLRKPFHRKLVLAGEATAEGPAQGTVHGAMESGLRAAQQIERLLNR